MKIRNWNRETDYPLAVSWWEAHGKDPDYIPGNEFLPRSGFVAENEEGCPLCMVWLYCYIDVPAAQVGYLVANPANTAIQSALALDELVEHIVSVANRIGVRLTARFTDCGLIRRLERHGFVETAREVVELVKKPEVES